MLRNILIATVITCPLMLTLIAQDPALPEERQLDPTKTSQTPAAETLREQRNEVVVKQSETVAGNRYLKTYSLNDADPRVVQKTLATLGLPNVEIVNDEKNSQQLHVLASVDHHNQIRNIIRKLDGPEAVVVSGAGSGEATAEREFDVSVAWIRKDWSEQLGENQTAVDELKELYVDVDLKALGGDIFTAAPSLLFPENRASIFDVESGRQLIRWLVHLRLLEEVSAITADTDETSQFTLERYVVPDLEFPVVAAQSIGNHGPFAKHKGVWSFGVGKYNREEGSVICDTVFTQFVEMQWPSRTKELERRQIASDHFGCRFAFEPREISVIRWPAVRPGQTQDGIINMLSGRADSVEETAKAEKKHDHWFPVIILGYASDPIPESLNGKTWIKPLRTMQLNSFDYVRSRVNSRRSMASMFGYNRVTSPPSQPKKNADNDRGKAASFQMIPLKFVEADETSKLVRQMFAADDGVQVLSDPNINSLYISAPENSMTRVKEIVAVLDSGTPRKARLPGVSSANTVEMEVADGGMLLLKGTRESVSAAEEMLNQMSSQQLHAHSQKLEKEAASVAARYATDGTGKRDLAALRQTVSEDFEVRQRLQLAEIEFLKARLDDLERRVRQKEKLKTQIIDRRIETLLKQPQEEAKKRKLVPKRP